MLNKSEWKNNSIALQEHVAHLQDRGNDQAAQYFKRLLEKEQALSKQVAQALEVSVGTDRDGGDYRKLVLGRGVFALLSMLVLVLIGSLLDVALGIALVFLTITVLLMFAFAYDVETEESLFNSRLLAYAMLLSTGMAVLATISLFVR